MAANGASGRASSSTPTVTSSPASADSPVRSLVSGRGRTLAADVVHEVNGGSVSTFLGLNEAMNTLAPRAAVALQIERGGKLMFVAFTLESSGP